jgi:cellobiose phosphorylase
VYQGTVLEHLLLQHLTPFFNVGEHNIIRLEGADWNDGLDMARARGESVAFTALYASNFQHLSELVLALNKLNVNEVEIATELIPLLDTLHEVVDYNNSAAKHERLNSYFESVRHTVSGQKVRVRLIDLANDLRRKSEWMMQHLRAQEWITNADGLSWFNGYYDNDGQRVEGDHANGVRMTLTGQVFALMGGIATDEQAREIVRAADKYLYEANMGGYRLNTDFGAVLLNLGRCFGFAFGHKENGAMFSHMAVMYANALYQRGFVAAGYKVLNELYQHCQNFEVSRIYPSLPEYISARGRGMYPYLTGSASWYLLTLITEVFGVKGRLGDLTLAPKLLSTQFDAEHQCGLKTLFAGRLIDLTYHTLAQLEYGAYQIEAITIDGAAVKFDRVDEAAQIDRAVVAALAPDRSHTLDVILGAKA